uniref:5-formyltetrahydrofolate cyclo-ligase n=1 Tax=Laticauda laticaudata TaxID=8630 RepID=A0A8C5SG39_LATLA
MAAKLHAAKRALRAELKRRLEGLSEAEKLRQSRLLAGKVMVHPCYLSSRRIAVFLSMPDEVQTNEIIKDIFQKGKECFIPWYKSQSSHMDMVKLASYEEIASLPLTSWNIHQPAEDDMREDALATAGKFEIVTWNCDTNRMWLIYIKYRTVELGHAQAPCCLLSQQILLQFPNSPQLSLTLTGC